MIELRLRLPVTSQNASQVVIELQTPMGLCFRKVAAAVYQLAAAVELEQERAVETAKRVIEGWTDATV